MADGEPTDLGGEVSVSVSMLPAEEVVADEEEEIDEREESGHTDDEEDVDDINHAALSKESVHANSPTQRVFCWFSRSSSIESFCWFSRPSSIEFHEFHFISPYHSSRSLMKNNFINFHFTSTVEK